MENTTTKETIVTLCRSLKLAAGMADRAMTITGKTHQEYLISLLSSEVQSRRDARVVQRLNRAKMPYQESFDDYDPSEVRFPESMTFEEFRELKFYQEKENVLMYGGSGTGKTMLAICIGMKACMADIPVRFFRTEDLITRLKEARAQGRLTEFKEKHSEARIIILDEFGYLPYDLEGSQLLFNFISAFYQKASIIMTTNKDFSEWKDILGDLKLTKAFAGRIVHHCELITFPGKDRRIMNSRIAGMYQNLMATDEEEE